MVSFYSASTIQGSSTAETDFAEDVAKLLISAQGVDIKLGRFSFDNVAANAL
jgi:hypothetical protein